MHNPDLDSRDLVLMRALDTEGGVTRAARALGLTQSAVSHHLARLEEKLGVALFSREGRGMSITPAGRRLVEGGNALLDQLIALEQSMRPQKGARLRVTTQCHTAYDWLAPVLGRFSRAHPSTRVVVKADFTRQPVKALLDKKVDLALCHAPVPEGLLAAQLGDDPFVVLLPLDHAAAKRQGAVRPADLAHDTLIVHDVPREELIALGKDWFGDRPPARTMRLLLTEAMVELVASGYGVAMMPRWTARQALRRRDVVVRRFSKRSAIRSWRAVYRAADKDRDDLQRLIAELTTWFQTRTSA